MTSLVIESNSSKIDVVFDQYNNNNKKKKNPSRMQDVVEQGLISGF